MSTDLPKTYDPATVESQAYQTWLNERAFAADPHAPGEPYCIVIPPPNVTGALHLGHAINNTLQDILTRMHRMKGFNTVWIPGIDHAVQEQWLVDTDVWFSRQLAFFLSELERLDPSGRLLDSTLIVCGNELRHGDLVIHSGRREVLVGDEEIQLAPKEFDLLWELLDHRGIVLTRDQLLERVWGYTFAGDTRTVDVHVRQIRRKLGDASPIVTVWGVGYKVASDRAPAPTA